MANNNEVEVKISASTSDLSAGMSQAESRVKDAADNISSIADGIKNAFAGVKTSLENLDIKINLDMTGLQNNLNTIRDNLKNRFDQISNDASIQLKVDDSAITSQLNTVKNAIRTQLGDIEANIKINADTSTVTRSASTIASQLQTALGAVDIALNLSANMSNIAGDISAIKSRITTALGNVKINLQINTTALNTQLAQIRTRINAYFSSVVVRLVPTLTGADATAARARLQSLVSRTYKAKVGIDLSYLNAQIAHARSMLNGLGAGLNLNIDTTASGLIHALNELRDEVKRLRTGLNSGGGGGGGGSGGGGGLGGGIASSFTGNLLAGMAQSLIANLGELSRALVENARQIENMSRLSNASTTEFQEWAFASKSVGISQEKLGDIMKDVNDKFGDYMQTGGGEMADFFDKIAPKVGVTAKEFQNLSGPQILQKYYETLQKANVSHAEMTFYMESIANDGSLLAPILDNNGQKLAIMADEAHKLGIILDAEALQATREFGTALSTIQAIVAGTAQRMMAEMAPALTDLAEKFKQFSIENRDAIDSSMQTIIQIFQDLLGIVSDIFGEIGQLWVDLTATTDNEVVQQIGIMDILKGALQALAIVVAAVRAAIQIAFALIRQIVIEVLSLIIDKVITAEKNFALFKTNVQFYLDALGSSLKTFANIAENALKLNFSGIQVAWETGFNNLENLAQQRSNSIAKINQEAINKSQANLAVRDEGRNLFKGKFFGALYGLENTALGLGVKKAPKPSEEDPKTAPNNRSSIGTGTKPSTSSASASNSKSKEDAAKAKAERERQEQERKAADLRYKYASEEEKIQKDLAKAIEDINKSKLLSEDEKRNYRLKAEASAAEKLKKLQLDAFQESRKLQEQAITEDEKLAQRQYDLEMAQLQALADAEKISNIEKIRREKALEDQLYQIKRDALLRRLDLEDEETSRTGKKAGQDGVLSQIADLDNQNAISDTKQPGMLSEAEMAAFEAKFGRFTERISGLWDKGIEAMMNGTLTWRNATNAVLTDMASFAIQTATQELQQWLKLQAIKLARKYGFIAADNAATTTGEATRTGIVAAGESARLGIISMASIKKLAIEAGATIKKIMMSAYEAMAGAWAAMVSIPYIGPFVAPVVAASAFAGVVALAGKIKSARGGYDIPAGVNPMTQLHEQEMVLPAQHANTIRQMGQMMMGGNTPQTATAEGGSMANVTNIYAWDSKDIKRFMRKNGGALAGGLKDYGRNFGK